MDTQKSQKPNTRFVWVFTLIFLLILSGPSSVLAGTFSNDSMDIVFDFPSDQTLTEVTKKSNYVSYTDDDFSSITIVVSDLYYALTNDGDATLEEQYPKDDIWLGCGLLDDTWNNSDYVLNYLTEAINEGNTQYTCSIDTVEIDNLPFYRFSYFEEEGNEDAAGGIIYLTVYRSKMYTVYFSNFYQYSTAEEYGTTFEQTLQIEGIDAYSFTVFEQETETEEDDNTAFIIGVILFAAAILATGLVLLLKNTHKKTLNKG
jgi:hypothetical protein